MTLRTVLEQIRPPTIRPGGMTVSGVTWAPDMTVAALVVAEPFQAELRRTIRLYSRPARVAVKSDGSTTIILFSDISTNEAKAAIVGSAEWLVRGRLTETGERDELMTREYGDILHHPRRWPSILKKLARG